MPLFLEQGDGDSRSESFVSIQEIRAYGDRHFGYEILGHDSDHEKIDDEPYLQKVARAAADYMGTFPWIGCKTCADQALSWPRILCEDDLYSEHAYYGHRRHNFYWYSNRSHRYYVPSNAIPEAIAEAQIRLVADILLGIIDPTGRTRPVIASSVSSESGSVSFHRPQRLRETGTGLQVGSRDPLQSVRHLVAPWMRIRPVTASLRRG